MKDAIKVGFLSYTNVDIENEHNWFPFYLPFMAQLSSLCKQKRFLKEDFYKRQFCFPFRFHICNGEDALNSLPIYQLCYFGLQCCFSCYLHFIFLESIIEVKELCPKTGSCFTMFSTSSTALSLFIWERSWIYFIFPICQFVCLCVRAWNGCHRNFIFGITLLNYLPVSDKTVWNWSR